MVKGWNHPDRIEGKEKFQVSHITFVVGSERRYGNTFSLIAGEAVNNRDKRPLFSGHITKGMAAQLRQLADYIEELEPENG